MDEKRSKTGTVSMTTGQTTSTDEDHEIRTKASEKASALM